jgi:hypothetical protein
MAGNLTVEQCGSVFSSSAREASANYGIGTDGRVGLYVDEANGAWTSSSWTNDNQAVTIEVANSSTGGDWPVSDTAYEKLIQLCVDICQRNGISSLNWTGDSSGNLTCHYMFASTACPGPYLKARMANIAAEVNNRLAGGTANTAAPSVNTAAATATTTTTATSTGDVPAVNLQAQTADGAILPWTTYPDYAGWSSNGAIVYLAVDCSWQIDVQAYSNGRWLPQLTNPNNIADKNNGCVGDGSPITGLKMYLHSPNGDKVIEYQVNCGSGYYPVQRDTETGNGQDGYAGDLVNPITEIKARIINY